MKINAEVKDLCRRIVENFHPQKVILFGSYASGKPNEDSDIDLLVVMHYEGRSVEQAIKIRQKISGTMPLDLLVRTPKQINERLSLGDFFIREIVEHGITLYESDNSRVD